MKFLAFPLLVFLLPFASPCTSGLNCPVCWFPCFDTWRTVGQELDYAQLHQVITTVRGAQASYNIKGSVYAFDRTANNANVKTIQSNLAAILAITQPVDNTCNPIFISRYSSSSAGTSSSSICQEKCAASNILENTGFSSQTSVQGDTGDSAGLGCYQGFRPNIIPWACRQGNDDKMAIVFANSPVRASSISNCFDYDVGVAIRISGDSQLLPFVGVPPTANLFQLDLLASPSLAATSTELLSCVRQCCGCGTSGGRKKRQVEENEVYVNETSDGEVIVSGPDDRMMIFDLKVDN